MPTESSHESLSKILDERVWRSCVKGWSAPISEVEGVKTPKDISTWTINEISECNWNSKGLHSIFMAVSADEFKRISMCETSKAAWDILETTHEGTKTVKNSKLQMLTTKFEEIRMKEDETFDEFYAKLNDIVNSSYNLGEKIPEHRVVRKVMRSLPERFRSKVTAIEESKDLDTVKIEELVGSLQTYEVSLPQPKKNKSIALRSVKEEISADSDEEVLDDAQLLCLSECPTYLKSKGKAMNASLSDDESKSSSDDENSSEDEQVNFMAFAASTDGFVLQEIDDDFEDSDVDGNIEESLQEAYNKLFEESLKLQKTNKSFLKKMHEVQSEKGELMSKFEEVSARNVELEAEVKILKCALDKSNTQLQQFSSGTKKLDHILSLGLPSGNRKGLGYTESQGASTSKTTFVPASILGKIPEVNRPAPQVFNLLRNSFLVLYFKVLISKA
ncbi:hypothetical protein CJ030_MR1G005712 [Morella rubra]|uniref:Gag-pol polyprotein n=1 Tax=Morella rubra TaxID=262757 RepID=A0A6A1WQX8_9ROSI|nr:hypothetical protein CJ030_MR1G005712 [Morella rubra]